MPPLFAMIALFEWLLDKYTNALAARSWSKGLGLDSSEIRGVKPPSETITSLLFKSTAKFPIQAAASATALSVRESLIPVEFTYVNKKKMI